MPWGWPVPDDMDLAADAAARIGICAGVAVPTLGALFFADLTFLEMIGCAVAAGLICIVVWPDAVAGEALMRIGRGDDDEPP